MSIGRRRDKIVLQSYSATQDDYGQEVEAWSDVGEEWAEVQYGRGDERRQAAMEQGSITATFVVDDNSRTRAVTLRDRIAFVHSGGEWDIFENIPGKPGERRITATRTV